MEEQNDLKKATSASFNTLYFHCLPDTQQNTWIIFSYKEQRYGQTFCFCPARKPQNFNSKDMTQWVRTQLKFALDAYLGGRGHKICIQFREKQRPNFYNLMFCFILYNELCNEFIGNRFPQLTGCFPLVLTKYISLGEAGWCFKWTLETFSLASFFFDHFPYWVPGSCHSYYSVYAQYIH